LVGLFLHVYFVHKINKLKDIICQWFNIGDFKLTNEGLKTNQHRKLSFFIDVEKIVEIAFFIRRVENITSVCYQPIVLLLDAIFELRIILRKVILELSLLHDSQSPYSASGRQIPQLIQKDILDNQRNLDFIKFTLAFNIKKMIKLQINPFEFVTALLIL
jgi:hypothetical protein